MEFVVSPPTLLLAIGRRLLCYGVCRELHPRTLRCACHSSSGQGSRHGSQSLAMVLEILGGHYSHETGRTQQQDWQNGSVVKVESEPCARVEGARQPLQVALALRIDTMV